MRVYLVISQVLYLLFLVLWFTMWALSAMLFDGGVTAAGISIFAILSAYPIAAVGCSIAAWVLYRKQKRRSCLVISLIPSAWVITMLAVLWIAGAG